MKAKKIRKIVDMLNDVWISDGESYEILNNVVNLLINGKTKNKPVNNHSVDSLYKVFDRIDELTVIKNNIYIETEHSLTVVNIPKCNTIQDILDMKDEFLDRTFNMRDKDDLDDLFTFYRTARGLHKHIEIKDNFLIIDETYYLKIVNEDTLKNFTFRTDDYRLYLSYLREGYNVKYINGGEIKINKNERTISF